MTSEILSLADLERAFDRVLLEHQREKVFVTSPAELAAIRETRERWLKRLYESLLANTYVPSPAQVCDVPKSNAAVRPGVLLSFADQVVYAACVGNAASAIVEELSWASPAKDYAYRITDPEGREWLRNAYYCWNDFRKAGIEQLDSGALLMVSTDVTCFYEHISHEMLMSDLRGIGVHDSIVALFERCLSRWTFINGRGLPQSHNASHILAKLYLNVVDRSLHEAGFRHNRYVDDIRIFCGTNAEAKRALLHLSTVIRRRGLSLQSAKTEIMVSGKARDDIEGVMPTLNPLIKLYIKEIAESLGIDPKYLTVTEAEEALAKSGASPPTELLRHAYQVHFIDGGRFEKTLFHYLLTRLRKAKDDFAADHVLTLIEAQPDETDWILNYYGGVRSPRTSEDALVDYLKSDEAIYPYQHYLVIRWRSRFLAEPADRFIGYVRSVFAAPQTPFYLRSAARLFLSHHGSTADLDNLATAYAAATDEAGKAECLLSVYRMEKGRRNAFLGQAKHDGILPAGAVALVKNGVMPTAVGAA